MAILSPLPVTADLLDGVLTKVRRGIALARMSNTTDFSTGIMCDLPEKIDFELTVVRTHQSLTRNTVITEIESGGESELESEAKTLLGTELETSTSSGVGLDAESNRESDSTVGLAVDGTSSISSGRGSSLESSVVSGVRRSQTEEFGRVSGTSGQTRLSGETEGSNEGTSKGSNSNTGSTSGKTGVFTRNSRTGKSEAECSDKCITTNTQRNYWRLDESSGAIAQAS